MPLDPNHNTLCPGCHMTFAFPEWRERSPRWGSPAADCPVCGVRISAKIVECWSQIMWPDPQDGIMMECMFHDRPEDLVPVS